MPTRLSSRLAGVRRGQFVGRAAELNLFESALTAPDLPFSVLYVYGPGGIGKSTLLREFAALAETLDIPAIVLDARRMEPSPEAFFNALRLALDLETTAAIFQALETRHQRHVVLIDTYELLAPLDSWLRDVFLPQLPDDTLVVLAARNPPVPEWRMDPGWQILLRPLPLRNLSPDESRDYLARRSIPIDQYSGVLAFTHGHPLALSLIADMFAQRGNLRFQPDAAPDIVKTLLEQFVQKVPGPAHRAALEACALVRLTTEALLSAMLATPDVHELFAWLRGLSFIESGPLGLFPHDLAREALAADLRWRNPDWFAELHARARRYYSNRLTQIRGPEQQRILADYIYLHRDHPMIRPFFDWGEGGSFLTDSMRPEDVPALVRMVDEHEGKESAHLASRWFARQPRHVLVCRDAEQQPIGFLTLIALDQASMEDIDADPAARAAWSYIQHQAPLRSGERATIFRFWMARDTYQDVSAVQSLIFINAVRHYLTTPGLAWSLLPLADADFWAPMCAYADLTRLREADFEVGGRHYGVYGHDWRVVPPLAWLDLMGEREIETDAQDMRTPAASVPLVVLSEHEFAATVREALREFSRPDDLRGNALLRSRLVVEQVGTQAGESERIAALRKLLNDALASLMLPRQAKFYRALQHTYFQPAPSQERAAEILDLPFSTYRRHLKAGVSLITEVLWQQEIAGPKR